MSLIERAITRARIGKGGEAVSENRRVDPAVLPDANRSDPRSAAVVDNAPVLAARQFSLAEVDASAMERHGVMPHVEDQAAVRSYRILRTRVQQRLASEGWQSIAVTSATPGEGKTVTALNLAMALAQDPRAYVFLVDLDLQRPQIANYLGLSFKEDLRDYLLGESAFDDVVYSIGQQNLRVIPNSNRIECSSEHLNSPRMRELARVLCAESPRHIVIYDMPPILMSDDVLTFAPQVDCMLLVVGEGIAPRSSLENAKDVLKDFNLLGTVLNRTAEKEPRGYYYYE